MTNNRWLYFSDRPVGVDSDLLWIEDGASTRDQVRDVAERITRPLLSEEPGNASRADSDSMTFAIHAEWGCGKSSLLRMIAETARRSAGGNAHRLVQCDYVASAYVGVDADVRSTLAMRALTSLAGSPRMALRLFETATVGSLEALPSDPSTAAVLVDQTLRRTSHELARVIDFPELLAKEIRGEGQTGTPNSSRVLAILIDDLDRCSPALVSEILDITQQWGSVPNLFFVLALDHQALRQALLYRAQKDGGSTVDPDHALEKYVQHTITLPPLDTQRLRSYVTKLLATYGDDAVSHAISDNVQLLEKGLRIKTPRAVKRCLNTIRPDIRSALDRSEPPEHVIKRRVLQYSWRDFHDQLLTPALQGDTRAERGWRELESACIAFVREEERDDEKLNFLTARLKPLFRGAFFDAPLPRDLVRYIALAPHFFFGGDERAAGDDIGRQVPFRFDMDTVLGGDSEVQFMTKYYEARTAEQNDDRMGALQNALEAYKVAGQHGEKISADRANEIGNLALWVEKFGAYDFADVLFALSLRMQPRHPNNMMNYASFIADHREARLDEADALLSELRTRYASHKPERRALLEAQVARLRGEVLPGSAELRESLMKAVREESEDEDTGYLRALTAAKEFSDPDLAWLALEESIFGCTQAHFAYRRLRGLADALAERREDTEARHEAMEIYRRLLERRWLTPDADTPAIQSNFAVLLYAYDWDEEAGMHWYASYSANQKLGPTRNTYAQYLGNNGRPDLAARALKGQPIEERILGTNSQPLPAEFAHREFLDRAFAHVDSLGEGTGDS
ncbi:MAG: hypothetical protein AMXMBFR64_30720 [Myxococcales bacterium]